MTNRQKIILSVFTGILVVAIISLTIGIVMVAGMVNVKGSLSVSYVAENTSCTISSYVQVYNGDGTTSGDVIKPTPDHIEIEGSATTTNAGTMKYDNEVKIADNGNGYVILTFEVTNDARTDIVSKPIMAVVEVVDLPSNMRLSVNNDNAKVIYAGEKGTVTVKMEVVDASQSAMFEGQIVITVSVIK